jgi:hypothetical protein
MSTEPITNSTYCELLKDPEFVKELLNNSEFIRELLRNPECQYVMTELFACLLENDKTFQKRFIDTRFREYITKQRDLLRRLDAVEKKVKEKEMVA